MPPTTDDTPSHRDAAAAANDHASANAAGDDNSAHANTDDNSAVVDASNVDKTPRKEDMLPPLPPTTTNDDGSIRHSGTTGMSNSGTNGVSIIASSPGDKGRQQCQALISPF